MIRKSIKTIMLAALAAVPFKAYAQNPYMPMWEYVPDGEPYVFEDPDQPGKQRVYVYGSHDSLLKFYCGLEQVVWSAPVEDLTNWRYDGVIFKSVCDANGNLLNEGGKGDVLYAPDVTMRVENGKKTYYLYPNNQAWTREGMVAKSDRPDGPFVVCNWDKKTPTAADGVLRFDPAVFIDDDGRVYGYWGFEKSYGAEFDPHTMATIKKGCQPIEDMVSSCKQDGVFRFFEASSMRKIKDKYVFIYSRMTAEGEFGLPSCNYTLAYAYGDNPLGPFTYGGTIIDGRARDVDDNGKTIATANPYGNTHGSICEINGKWWVFYHRQTGTNEYSRQAMVAPITVDVEEGPGGKVTISEGEYNSEGFQTKGLNPLYKSAAGWACYLTNPKPIGQEFPNFFFNGSYIQSTRINLDSYEGPFNLKQPYCPVVNNTSGSVVGYKYFNFDYTAHGHNLRLKANIKPEGVDGKITVLVGGPKTSRGGKVIGEFTIKATDKQEMQEYMIRVPELASVRGKQPLFFVFSSDKEDASICTLYDFQFIK